MPTREATPKQAVLISGPVIAIVPADYTALTVVVFQCFGCGSLTFWLCLGCARCENCCPSQRPQIKAEPER